MIDRRAWGLHSCCALAAMVISGFLGADTTSADPAQDRLSQDVKEGRPIVAHVIVALCDNKNQGIVPVPATLGNGQDPGNNLYWGAMYGVRSFLSRSPRWKVIHEDGGDRKEVLERLVLRGSIPREDGVADLYIVAEAWDGKEISAAVHRFTEIAAGEHPGTLELEDGDRVYSIPAGGSAHVVAYVGHNALMDMDLARVPAANARAKPRGSIVLACVSRPYFAPILRKGGSHPLVLTTGLMAPEAYTLDAALVAWAGGGDARKVQEASARAYNQYQKCGLSAARRLFGISSD